MTSYTANSLPKIAGKSASSVLKITGLEVKLPSVHSWIALSSDSIRESRLQAGNYALIAASQQVASKISANASNSNFGPSSINSKSQDGEVKSHVNNCSIAYEFDFLPDRETALAMCPGSFVHVARIWPGAKVPRGAALLSESLAEVCGKPPEGTVLFLYRYSQLEGAQEAGEPVTCKHLVLQLVYDAQKGLPAAVPRPQSAAPISTPSKPSKSSATSTPRQSKKAPSTPKSSASTPGTSTPEPAVPMQTPRTPTSQQSQATENNSILPDPTVATTPNTALTPPDDRVSSSSSVPKKAGAVAARDWVLRAVADDIKDHREVIERIASHHLRGRALLPGNLVTVPVLGHTLLCLVRRVDEHELTVPPCPSCVGPETAITLLYPGESVTAHAPQSAAASPDVQSNDELVRRARDAASAVVSGSGRDAAMDAAERALRTGLASGGLDYSHLGGISTIRQTLHEQIILPLRCPQLFHAYGVRPPRGLLLHGPPGSGKTVLARAAASAANAALFVISGPDVISEFYGESEAGIRGIFAAARALSPSLIFLDEIDALAPARSGARPGGAGAGSGGEADAATRVVATLLTLMDGIGPDDREYPLVVLAATNRVAAVDPALRRPGRFEREIEVGPPSPADREDILRTKLKRVAHSLTDTDIANLAAAAHGFVSADVVALVNEAAMVALRRVVAYREAGSRSPAGDKSAGELVVRMDDFRAAATRVRPSGLREVSVEVARVRWSDVGGLGSVKQALKEAVEWPTKIPEAMSRLGATPPRGVLLYGPPGCSKTLLARAVATEAGLNFLSIKGGELFSKYVGESERAVASLFARARAAAPSIVFFDELDGLAGGRSTSAEGSGSGVSERVLSQLLTEMDGLQRRGGVTVIGATNRPDRIDAALLRPGRFDRLIYVPPPDEAARHDIFLVHLRSTPVSQDVDVRHLAARTPGYTGADISAVVREAGLAALEEDLEATEVCQRHFDAALHVVGPSAPPSGSMLKMYEDFQRHGSVKVLESPSIS